MVSFGAPAQADKSGTGQPVSRPVVKPVTPAQSEPEVEASQSSEKIPIPVVNTVKMDEDGPGSVSYGAPQSKFASLGLVIITTLLLVVAIAAVVGVYVWTHVLDSNLGSDSPTIAAAGFISSLDPSYGYNTAEFLPREIRSQQSLPISEEITTLLSYTTSLRVTKIQPASQKDFTPGPGVIINNIKGLFNTDVDIKQAVIIPCVVDAAIDSVETTMTIDVICIRCRQGWYVYPASPKMFMTAVETDFEGSADAIITEPRVTQDTTVAEIPTEYVPEDKRELDKYTEVRSDLEAGKVEIDGYCYYMPHSIADLGRLISLTDISAENTVEFDAGIRNNQMYKDVDINIVKDIYSKCDMYCSVGNPLNGYLKFKDAYAVSFYIGIPHDRYYAYPNLFLPGNVTFGNTYEEVKDIYGNLIPFEDASGSDIKSAYETGRSSLSSAYSSTDPHRDDTEEYIDMASDLHLWEANTTDLKVYGVELKGAGDNRNKQNWIYLEFYKGGDGVFRLVAVEWHVWDMTDLRAQLTAEEASDTPSARSVHKVGEDPTAISSNDIWGDGQVGNGTDLGADDNGNAGTVTNDEDDGVFNTPVLTED